MSGVRSMDAFNSLSSFSGRFDVVDHVNATDDQHFPLEFDFSSDLSGQFLLTCINFARLQRAPEGSCQSAACRSDHIIKGGGAGRRDFRRHFVMFGDRAVDAKDNRFSLCRQISQSQRTNLSLDSHVGNIYDLRHEYFPLLNNEQIKYVPN